MIKKTIFGIITILCIAEPCTEPVFSYALRNWRPDPYTLLVVYKGQLKTKERLLINTTRESAKTGRISVLEIRVVNCSDSLAATRWPYITTLSADTLPYCYLIYPHTRNISSPVWSGAFNKENIDRILYSPARKEIAERILDGHAGVWVLLESEYTKDNATGTKNGIPGRLTSLIASGTSYFSSAKRNDRKAFKRLKTATKQINNTQKILSPQEYNSSSILQNKTDSLPVKFSIYRLSRSNQSEKIFIRMLLKRFTKEGENNGPIAFPLFGRGRTLPPLKGEEINKQNVKEVSSFIAAPCACMIKAENPGYDLLFTISWVRRINRDAVFSTIEEVEPPLTGFTHFLNTDPNLQKSRNNASGFDSRNKHNREYNDNNRNNASSTVNDEVTERNNTSLILFAGPSTDYNPSESRTDNNKANIGSLFSKAEWSILILCNLILVGIMIIVARVLIKNRKNSITNND